MKKRFELLDLLRLFAIVLILNSHSDALYPIPALATGGAAGNSLFFLISGYLLKTQSGFADFARHRVLRLYPAVWIVVTVDLLLGFWHIGSVRDLAAHYLWPTSFWFIGAIVLFDVLVFYLDKLRFTRRFGLFSAIMAIVYTGCYLLFVDKTRWSVEEAGLGTPAQCFKLIYSFYIYALGHYLRQHMAGVGLRHKKTAAGIGAAAFAASFAVKLVFEKWPATLTLQAVPQLLNVVSCYVAMRLMLVCEDAYCRHVPERARQVIRFFAAMSLEIYLVQFDIIRLCSALPFPVNTLLMLTLTCLTAWGLHAVCGRLVPLGQRRKTQEDSP